MNLAPLWSFRQGLQSLPLRLWVGRFRVAISFSVDWHLWNRFELLEFSSLHSDPLLPQDHLLHSPGHHCLLPHLVRA